MSCPTTYNLVRKMHRKFGLENDCGPTHLTEEEYRFRCMAMMEELFEYMEMIFNASTSYGHHQAPIEKVKDTMMNYIQRLELKEGVHKPESLEEQFDALIDLSVFTMGTSERQGFPFEVGFSRVMEKNLEKELGATQNRGGFTRDLVKPEGWTPPVLIDLVTREGQ
jgi:predicted HAD superfamily Cof-like phosphohydrolase